MPLIIIFLGVAVLLVLITKFKLNTFVSLIIVSYGVALALGIPFSKIVKSIEGGIGGTLGHIALIFGVGAMLGRLIADAGGAQRIAMTLIGRFGEKRIEWAVVIASFIIGVALFFEVGLVLLIPIIFTMAKQMKISVLRLGVPMVASLLATHAFLPPHPGPTVIAGEYGANIGMVLIYGIIIAIPAIAVGGTFYNKFAKRIVPSAYERVGDLSSVGSYRTFEDDEMPGFGVSVLTAMLPVVLMSVATIVAIIQAELSISDGPILSLIRLIGDASSAMLISIMLALYTMGFKRNIPMSELMKSCGSAVAHIGMMLLIIGGGGAFKQVLIDGGVGTYIATLFAGSAASPIIFAWGVAAILRVSLGSATVAAISTAGLVIPVLANSPANLALVTLATGAGSGIASHVNDAGFWMFKEFFGLSMKETFLTWTVLSTLVSVTGLLMILLINAVIG